MSIWWFLIYCVIIIDEKMVKGSVLSNVSEHRYSFNFKHETRCKDSVVIILWIF